jgi:N-sulfoglucosamine sulfohydrolase
MAFQNDPRMTGRGEIFERYPYADPATANFYQRTIQGEKLRAG